MYVALLDEQVLGERLGRDVADAQGHVLLRAGQELTPHYLEVLRRRGFRSVPIGDPLAPKAHPVEVLRGATRTTAQAAVARFLDAAAGAGAHPAFADSAARTVEQILRDVFASPEILYHVECLRSVDEDMLVHAVNVCVYSVILGPVLGLDRGELRDVGMGALLHDIGKVFYKDLVAKPRPLTPAEYERIQGHAAAGFDLLRQDGGLNLLSAHIAFQHHERLDGSGYPRGIDDAQIHPWAKLVAVADVYDALTADRAYGSALSPHAALAEVRRMADAGQLDASFVRHLALRLSAFPDGSVLLLSGGEVAVVVEQTTEGGARPRVRVLTDAQLRLVSATERVLDPGAVRAVLHGYPRRVREQLRSGVGQGVRTAGGA